MLLLSFSAKAQEVSPQNAKKKGHKVGTNKAVQPQDTLAKPPNALQMSEAGDTIFDPKRELSLINNDTTTIDEGNAEIVEISEQINIDSIWVRIAEYYSIWDNYNVNPYDIDPVKFKDTVPIRLYDTAKAMYWSMPIRNTHITSDFGFRGYRFHYGTDLELDRGDTVVAAFDGIVRIAKYNRGGYGYYIMLRHFNGLETLYGHLSRMDVEVGEMVTAGQKIGLGGSTGRSSGPHLHYEVRYQGNAIDPTSLYDFSDGQLLSSRYAITPQDFHYQKEARKIVFHRVRRGQTLSHIARRYHTSISRICRLNGISRNSIIRAGQRLRVR